MADTESKNTASKVKRKKISPRRVIKKAKSGGRRVKKVLIDVRPFYIPLAILFSGLLISCSVLIAFADLNLPFVGETIACDSLEPLSEDCLRKYARDIDLNGKKFDQCLESLAYDDVIDKEIEKADEIGVQGTPHVIIGKGTGDSFKGFYAGGAQGIDYYSELIDQVKSGDLEDVKDKVVEERYGTMEELISKYKEAYEQQGLPEDQLDTYAKASAENEFAQYEIRTYNMDNAMVVGDDNAEVVLMVFSDFECPYCKTFAQETLSELETKYIDKGEIRFAFHDMPLESIHPKARRAANAARCANEQGGFYEYHNELFGIEN